MLLTSVFVLVNGIVFNRLNGLMIKCLITFGELKEVKCFKKIIAFKSVTMLNTLNTQNVWRVFKGQRLM